MGGFFWHNRKIFSYLTRNELHLSFNGKIFVYFSFAGYTIKDKTPYIKGNPKKHGYIVGFPIIVFSLNEKRG